MATSNSLDQQLQNIVFDLSITSNDGSASDTVQNQNPDLEIYGGDVRIFDEDGEIVETSRMDQFDVEIQANEKFQIANTSFDARTLKAMLNSEKFPGFVLASNAKTKIKVTHRYVGAAAVSDPPYNVRIVFFGKVIGNSNNPQGQ
jgi:hypothetical protein